MGFFDNLKKTAETMKAAIDEAAQADGTQTPGAPASMGVSDKPSATSQPRGGSVPQRGVVHSVRYNMDDNDYVFRMLIHVTVQAKLESGELGPETDLTVWASSSFAEKLKQGMEIPVECDPVTGIPTKLNSKAITAELKK